jgi:hypothetical protein
MAGGQGATFGQGSLGNSVNARLRSKKTDGGSADRELTGQAVTAQQGTLGVSRTKALTGSQITSARGTVTGSSSTAGTIASEVANETALRSHPDILWYANTDSIEGALADMPMSADYPALTAPWTPTSLGANLNNQKRIAFMDVPQYGTRAVRATSMSYNPDTRVGSGPEILTWRKWVRHGHPSNTIGTPINHCIGTQSHTELYARWCIMLEQEVWNDLNTEVKLMGLDNALDNLPAGLHVGAVMYQWQPRAPFGHPTNPPGFYTKGDQGGEIMLDTYWYGADYTQIDGGARQVFPLMQNLFKRDTWHCIEERLKLNTMNGSTPVADAARQVWFDDVLVYDRQNFVLNNYLPTPTRPLELTLFWAQIYHGGADATIKPVNYRAGQIAISTRRIGKPTNLWPAWRQNLLENTRINLGLNTQASVDPENSSSLNPNFPNPAPWHGGGSGSAFGYQGSLAYTTFRYAPELGEWGSIVGTVGGHNGYYGNEVVRFDIGTQQFAPMSDPYTSNSHPGSFFANGSGSYSDSTNGEVHINAGLTTDPTQPGPCHAYGNNVVLPPDSATGVGADGALISCVRAARSPLTQAVKTSDRTHIFDLGQSNRATAAWARYSTNLFSPTESGKVLYYGWAVYDTSRKKVYAGIEAGPQANQLKVLDCVTKQWTTPLTLSSNVYQFHSNAWHWTNNPDYIINFYNGPGAEANTLEIINISTGQVYRPGTTGTGPTQTGGYDFVQTQNKMVAFDGGVGSTPNRVWILTPPHPGAPGFFTTMPWTWTYQDVTGPIPPKQTADTIPHIGRFIWCDKVKCFLWWANGVDNVQAWRVRGFG